MMRRGTTILILFASLGCSRFQALREETTTSARVVGLEVVFPETERAVLLAQLEVHNVGKRPLSLSNLEWELGLDGRFFAAGTQPFVHTIEAGKSKMFPLVFPLVFRDMPTSDKARNVEIQWKGRIWAGEGASAESLPFSGGRRQQVVGAPKWEL